MGVGGRDPEPAREGGQGAGRRDGVSKSERLVQASGNPKGRSSVQATSKQRPIDLDGRPNNVQVNYQATTKYNQAMPE